MKFCKSEGCTCFFDIIFGVILSGCCGKHDKRYENKRLTKFQADILLYRCAKRKFKKANKRNYGIPIIMFIGVTIGGHSRYKKAEK